MIKSKYTIIIPTLNSVNYLKDSIQSVLSQDFSNYELIVSDNCSSDNTYEYVSSINHPNIKLIKPNECLGMMEHYEWALTYATGEWIVILGSDDGVMPYFFELLEFLTKIADKKGINVINSDRAYFFWDGCQDIYGNDAIIYWARAAYEVKSSKWALLDATIGNKDYSNLPQMYTTSLIRKNVIAKAKQKNNGVFYTLNPPDANGAAIICLVEKKYIESHIPISWVGSSPKSTGIRYKDETHMKKTFPLNKTHWPLQAGNFFNDSYELTVVDNFKLYFFAALLTTQHLQGVFEKKLYNSRIFKIMLFANLYRDIKDPDSKQFDYLKELCEINNIDYNKIVSYSRTVVFKLQHLFFRYLEKISRRINRYYKKSKMDFEIYYPLREPMRLMDAFNMIRDMDKNSCFIKNFIR